MVLQIANGNRDNFSYSSMKIYVVTPYYNLFSETVLQMGHIISLIEKYGKVSLKLSLLLFLLWSVRKTFLKYLYSGFRETVVQK